VSVMVVSIAGAAAALLALAPLDAQAQSYRCVDKAGKKHYGQTIPRPCVGLEVEQLSASGAVIKRIPPPPTKEELEAKEAAERKRIEDEAAAREKARRDRALLGTYPNEKSIDEARARDLAAHAQSLKELASSIEGLTRRKVELAKEMEFYTGNNKPPAKLLEDIRVNQSNIDAHRQQLAIKQKDAEDINARYDQEKKDYRAIAGAK
jgi:hypothetical protein